MADGLPRLSARRNDQPSASRQSARSRGADPGPRDQHNADDARCNEPQILGHAKEKRGLSTHKPPQDRYVQRAARISGSVATHALTVGAAGGLVIGMMTRTARGHTARPMRADRFDVACYALVLAAAMVRVAAPLVAPTWAAHAIICSAGLWSAGFGLYAVRYWPVLTRPRLDGKPG